MRKAILGLLALGLPIAATAATGEREFEHGKLGITSAGFQSDLRAMDRDDSMPSVGFEMSRRRDFLAARTAESGQHRVAAVSSPPSAIAAPEIDPTSAISGLTLLLGGIAVLRGRKARAQ